MKGSVKTVFTRRLSHAYPLYRRGCEYHFESIDRWLSGVRNLLSFGRQGLFVHDNTHHALYMAYSAVNCLNGDGSFDLSRWQNSRKVFETHIVED